MAWVENSQSQLEVAYSFEFELYGNQLELLMMKALALESLNGSVKSVQIQMPVAKIKLLRANFTYKPYMVNRRRGRVRDRKPWS